MASGIHSMGEGVLRLTPIPAVAKSLNDPVVNELVAGLKGALDTLFEIGVNADAKHGPCKGEGEDGHHGDAPPNELQGCCKIDPDTVTVTGHRNTIIGFMVTAGGVKFAVTGRATFTPGAHKFTPDPDSDAIELDVTYTHHSNCLPPSCRDDTMKVTVPFSVVGEIAIGLAANMPGALGDFFKLAGAEAKWQISATGQIDVEVTC